MRGLDEVSDLEAKLVRRGFLGEATTHGGKIRARSDGAIPIVFIDRAEPAPIGGARQNLSTLNRRPPRPFFGLQGRVSSVRGQRRRGSEDDI